MGQRTTRVVQLSLLNSGSSCSMGSYFPVLGKFPANLQEHCLFRCSQQHLCGRVQVVGQCPALDATQTRIISSFKNGLENSSSSFFILICFELVLIPQSRRATKSFEVAKYTTLRAKLIFIRRLMLSLYFKLLLIFAKAKSQKQ